MKFQLHIPTSFAEVAPNAKALVKQADAIGSESDLAAFRQALHRVQMYPWGNPKIKNFIAAARLRLAAEATERITSITLPALRPGKPHLATVTLTEDSELPTKIPEGWKIEGNQLQTDISRLGDKWLDGLREVLEGIFEDEENG